MAASTAHRAHGKPGTLRACVHNSRARPHGAPTTKSAETDSAYPVKRAVQNTGEEIERPPVLIEAEAADLRFVRLGRARQALSRLDTEARSQLMQSRDQSALRR